MSDNYLKLIPVIPEYIPDALASEEAQRLFTSFIPHADEVRVMITDNIEFIDQGSNWERVMCPMCESERRVLHRIRFHYTPKHASWLNMAEIEFRVFSRTCLQLCMPNEQTLKRHVATLELERKTNKLPSLGNSPAMMPVSSSSVFIHLIQNDEVLVLN